MVKLCASASSAAPLRGKKASSAPLRDKKASSAPLCDEIENTVEMQDCQVRDYRSKTEDKPTERNGCAKAMLLE